MYNESGALLKYLEWDLAWNLPKVVLKSPPIIISVFPLLSFLAWMMLLVHLVKNLPFLDGSQGA